MCSTYSTAANYIIHIVFIVLFNKATPSVDVFHQVAALEFKGRLSVFVCHQVAALDSLKPGLLWMSATRCQHLTVLGQA